MRKSKVDGNGPYESGKRDQNLLKAYIKMSNGDGGNKSGGTIYADRIRQSVSV